TGKSKIFQRKIEALLTAQFLFEDIVQNKKIIRIQPRIINMILRQWTGGPIRLLMAIVHFDAEFIAEQFVQTDGGIPQHARGLHGIEQTGKREAKVTPQTDQVIFGGMKNLFDSWVGKKRSKNGKVFKNQRIDQII